MTSLKISAGLGAYQHEILHTASDSFVPFRLLEILPDAADLEIRCTLINANLIDSPRFSALSYVWGDSKDVLPILVDGRRYHVTKNCFAALPRLRELETASRFWIDAICICQQEHVDKATQVLLMGQIYSTAENVLVWLGYSNDVANPDLASRNLAAAASLLTISELTHPPGADTEADNFLKFLTTGNDYHMKWDALLDLLRHP